MKRPVLLLLAGSLAFVPIFACSSSGSEAPPNDAGDTGTDNVDSGSSNDDTGVPNVDSAASNDGPASACNTLVNGAGSIPVQQVATDPPTLSGGTIQDGTYWMTDDTIYTGPGGAAGIDGSNKTTIQIAAGTIQVSSGFAPDTQTTKLTTSGSTFHAVNTCPNTNSYDGTFEVSTTTLRIELPNAGPNGATIVETFTKQQ